MAKHNPGKEKRSLQQYQQQELLTDPAGVKAGVGDLLHPCSFKGQRMAVAHPCPQKKWHEWRREVGESSQQWMERVNDSEEEDSSGEEEDLEEEGEEWKSEREQGNDRTKRMTWMKILERRRCMCRNGRKI
ncbi:hypothetical protein FQA47_024630 [Oryzias melastigma]|uniref:Uncharacterized protein n=1 Tax=Oryzias melastigma TaxID=30732 RepID=A0A834F9Z0_ORYME|nr:hypothetical protein FQA47_024630 [Oryzias melastigma]